MNYTELGCIKWRQMLVCACRLACVKISVAICSILLTSSPVPSRWEWSHYFCDSQSPKPFYSLSVKKKAFKNKGVFLQLLPTDNCTCNMRNAGQFMGSQWHISCSLWPLTVEALPDIAAGKPGTGVLNFSSSLINLCLKKKKEKATIERLFYSLVFLCQSQFSFCLCWFLEIMTKCLTTKNSNQFFKKHNMTRSNAS